MAHGEEWHALARLTGDALSGVVGAAADVHSAVSARVTGAVRTVAAGGGPRVATGATAVAGASGDAARTVYAGVGAAVRVAPHVLAAAVVQVGPESPPTRTRLGRAALAGVTGIWGPAVSQHAPLRIVCAVRVDDEDLPLNADAVAAAFPQPSGDLVVFLHGLGETDASWRRAPASVTDDTNQIAYLDYGSRLHDDLGVSAVYLRYDTGRHVSDNGRDVADLLGEVVSAWPAPVRSVTLVGHSMGGLVARSAVHQGHASGAAWADLVRLVVTLGTPHTGAPLEKAVHGLEWTLSRWPETRPLARLLGARSPGVRDLRWGAVVESDWTGPDAHPLVDPCGETSGPESTTSCFVAATLSEDEAHPVGRLFGDGLVRLDSAGGRSARRTVRLQHGVRLTGTGHLSLLHHPHVHTALDGWLRQFVLE